MKDNALREPDARPWISSRDDGISALAPAYLLVSCLAEVLEETNDYFRHRAIVARYEEDCYYAGPDQALLPAKEEGIQGDRAVETGALRLLSHFPDHFFIPMELVTCGPTIACLKWRFGPLWNPDAYWGIDVAICRGSRIAAQQTLRSARSTRCLDIRGLRARLNWRMRLALDTARANGHTPAAQRSIS